MRYIGRSVGGRAVYEAERGDPPRDAAVLKPGEFERMVSDDDEYGWPKRGEHFWLRWMRWPLAFLAQGREIIWLRAEVQCLNLWWTRFEGIWDRAEAATKKENDLRRLRETDWHDRFLRLERHVLEGLEQRNYLVERFNDIDVRIGAIEKMLNMDEPDTLESPDGK